MGDTKKIPPYVYDFRIALQTKEIVGERQRKGTFPWMIVANPFAEIIGSLHGASGRTQFIAKGSLKRLRFRATTNGV